MIKSRRTNNKTKKTCKPTDGEAQQDSQTEADDDDNKADDRKRLQVVAAELWKLKPENLNSETQCPAKTKFCRGTAQDIKGESRPSTAGREARGTKASRGAGSRGLGFRV